MQRRTELDGNRSSVPRTRLQQFGPRVKAQLRKNIGHVHFSEHSPVKPPECSDQAATAHWVVVWFHAPLAHSVLLSQYCVRIRRRAQTKAAQAGGFKSQQQRKQQKASTGTSAQPSLTPSEQRPLALKAAARSLQHVPLIKAHIEQERPQDLTKPVLAALIAKTDTATAILQSALDADPGSLTNREIDAMMMYEHAACLAYGLANVMTAQLAGVRVFPARHTFEVLYKQGYEMDGWDMFRLAPLVARLLCSAMPGFKVFLWVPARLHYIMAAVQVRTAVARFNDWECMAHLPSAVTASVITAAAGVRTMLLSDLLTPPRHRGRG